MSEIDKLIPSDEEREINGIKFKIPKLRVKHMGIISKLESPQTRPAALRELIKLVIKKTFPDANESQIDDLDFELVTKIMEALAEVNDLGTVKTTNKLG